MRGGRAFQNPSDTAEIKNVHGLLFFKLYNIIIIYRTDCSST